MDKEIVNSLEEFALNLRFSWNHQGDVIWRTLDPELWELTRNPWVVLETASKDKLEGLLKDPEFRKTVRERVQAERERATSEAWFQKQHPKSPLTCVAYFSMEYMLSEALPIYSGGLGNVAGDQLKAASDLGVPLVAVGLLYQQGYFRQVIDKEGKQEALFPYNSPQDLPITPLREENGEWLRVMLDFPGYPIWLRAWQVNVGRLKLYLLDSNDPANYPWHRGITSELYGGGSELRLMQEIILGVGGYRLLTKLGLKPEVCHLNEGHAAFAVLERARNYMQEKKCSFEEALAVTRVGNLFTTHTAVAAGFDLFAPDLISHYAAKYCQEKLGISVNDLLALGRKNGDDPGEYFNMAFLAVRASGAVNGVSELHGKVSRQIFSPLFPRWPEVQVPVGHVTNGVHMPSWDSKESDALWTEHCGQCRWLGSVAGLEEEFRKVSEERLWKMRNASRKELIEYARERYNRQRAVIGQEVLPNIFDENTLTLGFARRFATYKRPNMLLTNPERLIRLLTNRERPVQLIIAGKAHPADIPGQRLIQQWLEFTKRPEVQGRVIFLSDYDMLVAEQLVAGVDVWINTPRRPWEACGTSGMKVLINGGLNASVLDGWWAEAYSPEVGWAIGDGTSGDAQDAESLYALLENEIVPQFYARSSDGIPKAWLQRMRESMARLTPRFSATRTVTQYTEEYYVPQAERYLTRKKNGCSKQLKWQKDLKEHWQRIRFVQVNVELRDGQHHFELQLYLDDLDPEAIRLQLYADGVNGGPPFCQEMRRKSQTALSPGVYLYELDVPGTRPQSDYTPRAVPYFPGVEVPLEATNILWH